MNVETVLVISAKKMADTQLLKDLPIFGAFKANNHLLGGSDDTTWI